MASLFHVCRRSLLQPLKRQLPRCALPPRSVGLIFTNPPTTLSSLMRSGLTMCVVLSSFLLRCCTSARASRRGAVVAPLQLLRLPPAPLAGAQSAGCHGWWALAAAAAAAAAASAPSAECTTGPSAPLPPPLPPPPPAPLLLLLRPTRQRRPWRQRQLPPRRCDGSFRSVPPSPS